MKSQSGRDGGGRAPVETGEIEFGPGQDVDGEPEVFLLPMILDKHRNHTAFQQVDPRSPPNSGRAVNNPGEGCPVGAQKEKQLRGQKP